MIDALASSQTLHRAGDQLDGLSSNAQSILWSLGYQQQSIKGVQRKVCLCRAGKPSMQAPVRLERADHPRLSRPALCARLQVLDVANRLGVSNSVIRFIERRYVGDLYAPGDF